MTPKKAILVDVELQVRVVVDEQVDPNIDKEFDEAVQKKILESIKNDDTFISENIVDFDDDLETPYDQEYDE